VNGIHDMGGMHGFGPIVRERDEPVFHSEWERRMFAIVLAVMGGRCFNVDEFRRAIERMPPGEYLGATYYERWLYAVESLLIEKGVVARTELDVVMAALRAGVLASPVHAQDEPAMGLAEDSAAITETLGGGARALRHDQSYRPRFKAGDTVVARNLNPQGHTRLPRYARGHHGIIRHDWGVFVFPDTHAHGGGTKPQHCYAVEFEGAELWGSDHPQGERVYLDLWEDYLETAVNAEAHSGLTRRRTGKSVAKPGRKAAAKKI
jgi:nitrile hydratase beta subunit